MRNALDGLLVLSLQQAVAAPYCSSRLADGGRIAEPPVGVIGEAVELRSVPSVGEHSHFIRDEFARR